MHCVQHVGNCKDAAAVLAQNSACILSFNECNTTKSMISIKTISKNLRNNRQRLCIAQRFENNYFDLIVLCSMFIENTKKIIFKWLKPNAASWNINIFENWAIAIVSCFINLTIIINLVFFYWPTSTYTPNKISVHANSLSVKWLKCV